jgi:hypothetical protein
MRLVLERRRRRGWLFWRLLAIAAVLLAIGGAIDNADDPGPQCQRPNDYEACR